MDVIREFPVFLVTVTQDLAPVCMVSIQPVAENAAEVDVWSHDIEALMVAQQQFGAALRSVEFRIWKETGKLPTPPDFVNRDAPFDDIEE